MMYPCLEIQVNCFCVGIFHECEGLTDSFYKIRDLRQGVFIALPYQIPSDFFQPHWTPIISFSHPHQTLQFTCELNLLIMSY